LLENLIGTKFNMQSFVSSFQRYIKSDDIIVLAVSGGVDSMVLLDLVSGIHPTSHIIVTHFDHSIRWVESDLDRELVANICNSKKITFEVEKMDIAIMAKDEKMNLEALARRERYWFLERVRSKYQAKYILTAHHAVDQTETIIGNMIKWAKVRGLSGMSEVSGYIFRPLLQVTKIDIVQYATNNQIVYREDQSNHDTAYDRNKIRHTIIPVLESLNPSIHDTIGELGCYMQHVWEYLTQQVMDWLESQKKLTSSENVFLKSDFSALSPFFQSEIISYLYAHAEWWSTQGLSRWLIAELIRFIQDPGSYGQKEIKNLKLERRGEKIIILL
jgi:tRNA(Ile)-lysidine synthetase-like protein